MSAVPVTKSSIRMLADPSRVITKPLTPGAGSSAQTQARVQRIVSRILAISESEVTSTLRTVQERFPARHRTLESALEAYNLDADQSELCNNLAIAFECNGRDEEAEEACLRALDLNPMHAAAANNLGHLYERMMKMEPGRESENRKNAIDAWKQRLSICITQKRSLKAATTHLLNLGISQKEIDSVANNACKSSLRS